MLSKQIAINCDEFGNLPWPERAPFLKRFGFRSVEVNPEPASSAEDFATIRRCLAEHSLTAVACCDWYHFFSPNDQAGIKTVAARFIKNIERAREMGADRLIWYSGENDQYYGESAVAALLSRLEPVLKRAEALNVTLLLETEFSKRGLDLSSSTALLKKLMTTANTPWLRINFDAANVYVAGEEPFPFAYNQLKPWIGHVHLKDVRLMDPVADTQPDLRPQRGNNRIGLCCPMGVGAVNFIGLLNTLTTDHYAGYLSLELHMRRFEQEDCLTRGLQFLKDYYPTTIT